MRKKRTMNIVSRGYLLGSFIFQKNTANVYSKKKNFFFFFGKVNRFI